MISFIYEVHNSTNNFKKYTVEIVKIYRYSSREVLDLRILFLIVKGVTKGCQVLMLARLQSCLYTNVHICT